jgi:DNA-directed RNA polymerase subunit RPC12/RpoP
MKVPIKMASNQKVYDEFEIIKPRGGVLADTRKIMDSGDVFPAIKTFIAGCTEAIISIDQEIITDKPAIKGLINFLPYKSAEFLITKIFTLDPDNDAVEGIYRCPRCGNRIISELKDDIDTRDFISDLEINFCENSENIILELSEPVVLKNKQTNEILEQIDVIELRHPTMADCIAAERKFGQMDSVRLQFAMYVEALLKVNGNDIDNKYRNNYGMFIFENIKDARKDLGKLNDEINKYGIDLRLKKNCNSCGKEFTAFLNTQNFFANALMS